MRIIIPDITAFLEYFILAGELSYIDRRRMGRQNSSSRAKRAILYQFDRSCYDFRQLDNHQQSKDQEFSSMSCSRMQVC